MSRESSTESDVSGLDYEDTELTLGLPGGATGSRSEPDKKRGLAETDAEKPSAAKARVVGWPPVRSFQKNILKSCTYVKVAVDGAPYLRKVDLETFNDYGQLLAALEEKFSCFKIRNYSSEKRLVDPINGTEYMPTYEDKDGDWMLVGDVPWKMFVASCKRLRLVKRSEAINLAPIASEGSNRNAG